MKRECESAAASRHSLGGITSFLEPRTQMRADGASGSVSRGALPSQAVCVAIVAKLQGLVSQHLGMAARSSPLLCHRPDPAKASQADGKQLSTTSMRGVSGVVQLRQGDKDML